MDAHHDSPRRPSFSERLPSWGLLALLIASFTVMADRLIQVQLRVEGLEASRLDESLRVQQNVHSQIVDLDARLETSVVATEQASVLAERLENTEHELGSMEQTIDGQAAKLNVIEDRQADFGPRQLASELAAYGQASEQEFDSIRAQVATLESSAREASAAVQELGKTATGERDLERMWHELVGPVVQLSGDVSVGSGVLLKSREDPEDGSYRTHILTAWHVVRDIQGDLSHTDMPVPVKIYSSDGHTENQLAKLLVFNASLDAALLEITTEAPFPNGASLAPGSRLANLEIFDKIYAVGCPLGNDPIPTAGEIATVDHVVDGSTYLMINAPTYIGNSGGGIFDAETHELLGIFSKIYTHGSLRPIIVPHMGLVTPLNFIYDWLNAEGLASVIPVEEGTQLAVR